jgi:hypothetical protein
LLSNNSYHTPPSLDFGGGIKSTDSSCPIPFVFGASKTNQRKMVNERSPAKAPLLPVVPNDQPQVRQAESSKPPPFSVPQFGQPTLPQSPLHRMAPKQSSVFIQPKSRPEHHRDGDRPAHPHLQAFKDKVIDPLAARAPAAFQPQNKYA